VAPFFLRVRLADEPGALAALTEALAQEGVSVDKLLQDSAEESGAAPVVIVTHRCPRANMLAALARLEKISTPIDAPRLIRIEAAS
jgi:homoserine dehydrogenase